MLFGEGVVRTPEDFGSQGARPTHPDLLDWLARDFVDHGWDVKRLLRQMVMSATYRQRSGPTPEALEKDPENKLLSHYPRYRLPAEMLRDSALFTSGLLVDKVGGPPVRPYEVAASFKPMSPDKGEGLYRRSLYTFWKRTGPAPVMMTLDASKRDVCSVKRERTSTPLQALVLMNDPQFVEAARVFGQKLLVEHGEDVDAMVRHGFTSLTSRSPRPSELAILRRLFVDQRRYFAESPENAEAFLKVGTALASDALPKPDMAAAGILVSVMMNLDECVRKW
jgi:hypothetical protein